MPIDLSNATSEFGWEQWRWPKLLRLARVHGWRPAGTALSTDPNGDWDQNYTSNDGQIVAAEDAMALADALEAALPHIPDYDALAEHRRDDGTLEIAPQHPTAPDAAWFSTSTGKANVEAFIRFCREGAFQIS